VSVAGSPQREAFLDALRVVAASAVLAFHFGFRGAAHGVQDLAYPELAGIAKYGYLGVELFFMISGYVIPWSIRQRGVAEFAASRAIRLYPTFWLSVALLAAVPPLLGEWRFHLPLRDTLVNLTMLAELFGSPYLDGVFWTLATELQFYALVAAVVGLFGFNRLPTALLVWFLAGCVVTGYAKAGGSMPPYPGGAFFMYFCFGAACYFLNRLGERSARVYALLGLSLPLMLAHSLHKAGAAAAMFETPFSPALVLPLVLLGAAAVFFSHGIRIGNVARASFLGGITYPLYLLHENLGYAFLNTFFSSGTRWWGLACVVVFSYGIATAVYVWFDVPVRRALRRALGGLTTSSGFAR
jgi:peptidoglycan/LPS O-acetylase OafA/YrhL